MEATVANTPQFSARAVGPIVKTNHLVMEGVVAVFTGLLPRSVLNREGPARLAPHELPPAQVCLTHVDAGTAEPTAKARKNLVPFEVLEKDFEGDIRLWTVTGLRQLDMYRLISDRVKPLQLGEPGRHKVGKSCDVLVRLGSCSKGACFRVLVDVAADEGFDGVLPGN